MSTPLEKPATVFPPFFAERLQAARKDSAAPNAITDEMADAGLVRPRRSACPVWVAASEARAAAAKAAEAAKEARQ